MNMAKRIYVVGTCDTKGAELNYAADLIAMAGASCVVVDVSTSAGTFAADVSAAHVASFHPGGVSAVLGLGDRGKAVTAMAEAFTKFILAQNDIGAVLGMGGSGNSTIVTAGMRALPIGVPKLMVSTLASGNVASFVGASDITMMHSVADVAGLNAISRQVIGNAAHAVTGMFLNAVPEEADEKLPLGITMFGVTTECVSKVRQAIDERCECFVFHATGTGGQCMEKLVDSGYLKAVLDLTTTEVADHLFGGILPCTDDRFGSIIRTKVPYVGSVGALDMVNFGGRDTVPTKYEGRKFHIHNSSVTLMRTTPAENAAMGQWIVERLNQMSGQVRFLLPLKGVSAIDAAGQIFEDAEADDALFSAIRSGWKPAPNRRLVEVDAHINSAAFADAVVHSFQEIA
jgi:uncharacterized protein (UPF0261 family)